MIFLLTLFFIFGLLFAGCDGDDNSGTSHPGNASVTGISLNKTNTFILEGSTEQLASTIAPANQFL